MSYKIDLKVRPNPGTISVSLAVIKALRKQGKDALWEFFDNLDDLDEKISDVTWLRQIVNWTPEGGLAMTEMAKWMKLANKVNELNEWVEKPITLSQFQVDLIWSRMVDPKFKRSRMEAQFISFVLEFQKVTGKHFPDEEPDVQEDKKK